MFCFFLWWKIVCRSLAILYHVSVRIYTHTLYNKTIGDTIGSQWNVHVKIRWKSVKQSVNSTQTHVRSKRVWIINKCKTIYRKMFTPTKIQYASVLFPHFQIHTNTHKPVDITIHEHIAHRSIKRIVEIMKAWEKKTTENETKHLKNEKPKNGKINMRENGRDAEWKKKHSYTQHRLNIHEFVKQLF